MTWKQQPWLAIDIESTGPDPAVAEPVEVGLVWSGILDEQRVVTESTAIRVRPPCSIPPGASDVHGIRDDDVADAPELAEVAGRILDAVSSAPVVVTYNGWGFDLPILSRLVPGFRELFRGRVCLDALVVVRLDTVGRYWSGQGRHRLLSAARRSGLNVDEGRAHGAVYDCELTTALLDRWASRLPDDGAEAQRFLMAEKKKQDDNFNRWRAAQPPRETT